MTRYIDIPGFTPTVQAPIDPSLTDGHLLLIVPGKPVDGYWGSGLDIPNLAASRLAAITGNPGPTATVFNAFANPQSGQIERTAKNRPHFMVSHLANTSGGTAGLGAGAGIQIPIAVRDWIQAHPTHDFYLSLGFRLTRQYTGTSPTVYPLASLKSPDLGGTRTSVGITAANALAGTPASSSVERLGFTTASLPADAAEKFAAITSDGYALSGVLSTVALYLGAVNTATTNKAPSIAVTRLAIADLTAGTNLTHGGVAAADLDAWSASLSAGGYYNGDTNSDPAVLVP
ncbi:hypothetical protein [Microbacterium oleivorans]|uniref:Uncharacterized protein n=1 Tax=Microbacterium oleivorans TaxID=273677 RepID=A0A7D5F5T3_9MICO|nr:hypothetical protein [Microbacterium oleivorans]QLD10873.1 hypothetical protein HW566_03195 [Microbacterium oleivorans]